MVNGLNKLNENFVETLSYSEENNSISKEKKIDRSNKLDTNGYSVNYLKEFKLDSIIQPKTNETIDQQGLENIHSLNRSTNEFIASITCNFEENYQKIKHDLIDSDRYRIDNSNLRKNSVESIEIKNDEIIHDWKHRTSPKNLLSSTNESKSITNYEKHGDINTNIKELKNSEGKKTENEVKNFKQTKSVRFHIDNAEINPHSPSKPRSKGEFYLKKNKISSSELDNYWKEELNEIETNLSNAKSFEHKTKLKSVIHESKLQIPTKTIT